MAGKGKPCGASHISAAKTCRVNLKPDISNAVGKVAEKRVRAKNALSQNINAGLLKRETTQKLEDYLKRAPHQYQKDKIQAELDRRAAAKNPAKGEKPQGTTKKVQEEPNRREKEGGQSKIEVNTKKEETKKGTRLEKEIDELNKKGINALTVAALWFKSKPLGEGAMGEVRENEGPPKSIIKKGEIGHNEAIALERLKGTGVAPVLMGKTPLKNEREVDPGLGGVFGPHVNAGSGMMRMSYAKGEPVGEVLFTESKKQAIARVDSLVEARAAIHRAGVAHNDMHPYNVFYDQNSKKSEIIDFGLSQIGYKFALAEALSTNRDEDHLSQENFDVEGSLSGAKYTRFEQNRKNVMSKIGVSESDMTGVRVKEEDHPDWLKNMPEREAEKMVNDLYNGI